MLIRLIQEISDNEIIDLAYDYEYFDQAHFNMFLKKYVKQHFTLS